MSSAASKQQEQNRIDQKKYDEMVAELLKKQKVIEPVYLSEAPKILEEILNEQFKKHAWEEDITELVRNKIDEKNFTGTILGSVDCGSTLCKVTFTHNSQTEADAFEMVEIGGRS